jgi:hypothetical protein
MVIRDKECENGVTLHSLGCVTDLHHLAFHWAVTTSPPATGGWPKFKVISDQVQYVLDIVEIRSAVQVQCTS